MAKSTELNTWEKVCKAKGISDVIPFDVSMLPKETQNYLIAAYMLPIIIEVRNGKDWKPDYTKGNNQWKYELWLKVIADKDRPSGFGLSYDVCALWNSGTTVGVRFAFKSREVGMSVFEDFKKVFEHFMLIVS